jgi:hypothetical protein
VRQGEIGIALNRFGKMPDGAFQSFGAFREALAKARNEFVVGVRMAAVAVAINPANRSSETAIPSPSGTGCHPPPRLAA